MSPTLVPLAAPSQIARTPSRVDGLPQDIEDDLRAAGCRLIHEAGVLLRHKQVAIATAQVLFHRFWFVSSMKHFGVADIAMGALYLASKLEECPVRMRDVINVYDLFLQRDAHVVASTTTATTTVTATTTTTVKPFEHTPMAYFSDTFYELKDALVVAEMQILKRLAFNVLVVLPYGTLVNYLRLLGLAQHRDACTKAWGFLNDALQTPVYAIYAVPTIASAAILLASRHLQLALPHGWWELFDAPWEDVWSVCGHVMRLYHVRPHGEGDEARVRVLRMLNKAGVRRWLEETER